MEFLDSLFTTLHSLTRWVLIIFAALALVRAWRGWLGKRAWAKLDERAGLFFTSFMDLQLLFGLILYFFFSTPVQSFWQDAGTAMRNGYFRFFGIEHILLMLVAVVLAHVGRARSRKAASDAKKHQQAAIWYTIALLLVLISIPWPFSAHPAPWLRLFGLAI